MMKDWADNDRNLFKWREETGQTAFEKAALTDAEIPEQEYFDNGILMVAMVKAGVELAFEIMVESGMQPESAYYESLHETPLIANTIARNKLYEMNVVISDTAEYGNYLFTHSCVPLLQDFMAKIDTDVIGKGMALEDNGVDNKQLIEIDKQIQNHPVEQIGETLRDFMDNMKAING
jgi:ketol-acid reductoisomerase